MRPAADLIHRLAEGFQSFLQIILPQKAAVPFRVVLSIGLLAERIADVFFIGQPVVNLAGGPMDVPLPVWNSPADQIVHDPARAVAAEVGVEYPAYQFRLLRDDLHLSAALQTVAVGRLHGDELAQLHPAAACLPSVFGDGYGLLLG